VAAQNRTVYEHVHEHVHEHGNVNDTPTNDVNDLLRKQIYYPTSST